MRAELLRFDYAVMFDHVASGASSIPVNRDGEPEEASTRWAGVCSWPSPQRPRIVQLGSQQLLADGWRMQR
jgi:hypothetical protein